MDIKRSESVKKWIPLVPGKGDHGKIPTSILGSSMNPFEVIAKAERFRNMEPWQQEVVVQAWRNLNAKEQRPYKEKLNHLVELKQYLIDGVVTWEAITQPGKTEPLQRPTELRRENAAEIILPNASQTIQPSSLENTGARHFINPDSGTITGEESGTINSMMPRKRGNSILEESEEDKIPTHRYAGFGETQEEELLKEADNHCIEMRNDDGSKKRRTNGEPLRTADDSAANRKDNFHQVLKEVATYCDNIQMSQQGKNGLPLRACIFIDVNYMKDISPSSSSSFPAAGDMELSKPKITIVTNMKHAHHVRNTFSEAMKVHGDQANEAIADMGCLESREQVDSFVGNKENKM